MWEYLRAKQQEKREKGCGRANGEGVPQPWRNGREKQDCCSAFVLCGQASVLKPGEQGRCKIRSQKKASQELGSEEAKAWLRKCGSELRVCVASQERRNQCHDV